MAATATYLNPNIVRLSLLCNGQQLSVATGFLLKYKSKWYLCSNWHVFSGRDVDTGQPKHPSCAVPDAVEYCVAKLMESELHWDTFTIPLAASSGTKATWFGHPVQGQDADVAAVEVDQTQVGYAKDLLEVGGHDDAMFVDLGQELFLPGYPLGFSSNGHMAIWKRASLASSLEFGHGIEHFFYVDTATREGMSGSPCIAIANWPYYARTGEGIKMKVVRDPVSWRFLGVYSGRFNDSDSFEAQIGVVWRENLLFELLDSLVPATYELRSN